MSSDPNVAQNAAREETSVENTMSEEPAQESSAESTATTEVQVEASDVNSPAPADASANVAVESTNQQPSASSDESTSEAAPQEMAAAPRRKVQLNPSVSSADAKPVPTHGVRSVPPAPTNKTEQAVASESSADESASSSGVPAPTAVSNQVPVIDAAPPVEIPSTDEALLDAGLEAEIEAAMAGDTSSAQPSPEDVKLPEETGSGASLPEELLEAGTRLAGSVQSIHGDNIFLDLGFRSPGVLPARQFAAGKLPEQGKRIDVVFNRFDTDEGLLLVNRPAAFQKVAGNWDEVAVDQVVDCTVSKTNKGGLEIQVGSIRGFLPASQVDVAYVSDLAPYVGQKLRVKITEANREKRNLVVSRRAILEIERKEAAKELWKTLSVGQQLTGTVKTLKNYGAFIDLGGIDGFLHIGEISWSRIHHPSEVLQVNDKVEVKIVSIDEEKERISLGMKQLSQDPWANIESKYEKGTNVTGNVTRTADFGAFIRLEPGVEGLVHISELDYKHVRVVTDVLKVGAVAEFQVLEVDPSKKRISLSKKALMEKPEGTAPGKDDSASEPEAPAFVRKRKGPLKGGRDDATTSGGGMFGNPGDFS